MSAIPQTHMYADNRIRNQQQDTNTRLEPSVIQRKKNFLMKPLQKFQEYVVQVVFRIISYITSLPLKIGLRILDLIERSIRYVIWLNIKSVVSWINFVYRALAFFRITGGVKLLQLIAKNYFRQYSTINFDREEQNLSRFSLIMRKKYNNLINVNMIEKKVKTPTFFIDHSDKKKKPSGGDMRIQEREQPNQHFIQEGEGIHDLERESGQSPRLLGISKSHQRMKKGQVIQPQINPNSRNTGITVQIPRRNVNTDNRIFPDRDISPERYMKRIPRLDQLDLDQDLDQLHRPKGEGIGLYQNDRIRDVNEYPLLSQGRQNKEQLLNELSNLRGKMQELIDDNNKYIQELQLWLRQKSQTIMMTRKQNIQLLEEMQQLQKENIKKTEKLSGLQQRVKQMEQTLDKQKSQRTQLSSQIDRLNQQIQTKSIQIMVLKDKINKNYIQFEQSQLHHPYFSKNEVESSTVQNSFDQSIDDENAFEKLKKAEQKTYQLADRVQKLLDQENKRLLKSDIGFNPSQQKGLSQSFNRSQADTKANSEFENMKSSQNKGQKRSDSGKQNLTESASMRKNEPKVIKNEGGRKITMTIH